MAGEATSWRRGCKVCHWREHQVHPPRSHPQADSQVIILHSADSMWWRVMQCNRFSPVFIPRLPNWQTHAKFSFLCMALMFPLFSALFKPIQRLPWILSCTWPSTSHPHREPRWSVSFPLWRRRPPPPSGSLASPLPFPPCLAGSQLRPQPQPREPGSARPAPGWGLC